MFLFFFYIFRFYDYLSLVRNPDRRRLLREIEYLRTVTDFIQKRLVLCDEGDCRQCGRQHRQHVELPEDLQDHEPFQLIEPLDDNEELFEIVPNGLYPKYLYKIDVPRIRVRDESPDSSPALFRFSDPVKSGRCLLFRTNLLAQRFERWEIESGVMIFGPELRRRMKSLVNRAKNLSLLVGSALKVVPLHLRRHESFKCSSCFFADKSDDFCHHFVVEREQARLKCLQNFENLENELNDLDLEMIRLLEISKRRNALNSTQFEL